MPKQEFSARTYSRIRYRLLLLDLAGWFAFLIAFQLVGISSVVASWLSTLTDSHPLIIGGYFVCFAVAYYVLFLPIHFYGSFVIEHRFELSRLTINGWLIREIKQIALNMIFGILLIEGLFAILRHAQNSWPIIAACGWAGFHIVLARIFPTMILPIFYKTVRVDDEALVGQLLDLCRRVRLSALGVFRFNLGAETRKANAALAGLGKTRRVLLSDTLISEFPAEEIEGVLAHELAHHRYHHLTKLLLISAIGSWIAFTLIDLASGIWVDFLGLEGLSDIAGFPMLVLWLSALGILGLPLSNWISRQFEWQADRFAVRNGSSPKAFACALRRLGELNLADPNPPKWVELLFCDHPPIAKRIAAAEDDLGLSLKR